MKRYLTITAIIMLVLVLASCTGVISSSTTVAINTTTRPISTSLSSNQNLQYTISCPKVIDPYSAAANLGSPPQDCRFVGLQVDLTNLTNQVLSPTSALYCIARDNEGIDRSTSNILLAVGIGQSFASVLAKGQTTEALIVYQVPQNVTLVQVSYPLNTSQYITAQIPGIMAQIPLQSQSQFTQLSGSPFSLSCREIIDPYNVDPQLASPSPGYKFVAVHLLLHNLSDNVIDLPSITDCTTDDDDGIQYSVSNVLAAVGVGYPFSVQVTPNGTAEALAVFEIPSGSNIINVTYPVGYTSLSPLTANVP